MNAEIRHWALCLLFAAAAAEGGQECNPRIRETTPASRFVITSQGVAFDKKTGLMWKQCVEGRSGNACETGGASAFTWGAALMQADASSFAGYTDWRVPNVKELLSIVEEKCSYPSANEEVFPHNGDSELWSSSPRTGDSKKAWVIAFDKGVQKDENRDDKSPALRLVRGRTLGF